MPHPLDFLYTVRADERAIFGRHWLGATELRHGEKTLIATYPPTTEEGTQVEVYCTAMPARFYEVVIGDYSVTTGSGSVLAGLVADMAKEIAEGMLQITNKNNFDA